MVRKLNRIILTASFMGATALAQTAYRQPPKGVLDVLDAPETPRIIVSPARTHALLVERLRYPPVAELAEPMLRLAGVRINPRTNGPHSPSQYVRLTVLRLDDGTQTSVRLPANARLSECRWNPDGSRFTFLNTTETGIEAWAGEAASGAAGKIADITVNAAYGEPLQWMPDGRTLLLQLIPAGRGVPPAPAGVPEGPVVQESSGASGPLRTYQDLLQNAHDEDLFDYYAASQLALVDVETGKRTLLGQPALFQRAEPSPDGKHVLVVRTLRPYSFLHPHSRFPMQVDVWDRSGKLIRTLVRLPLADNVPIGGVPTGPRLHSWQPTVPATLVWVEALDEGDPKKKVPHRDRILHLKAPFAGEPEELFKTEHRFAGLRWGERGDWVLASDYDRDRRWRRTFLIDADKPAGAPQLIWSHSVQDRYGDPGDPVLRTLPTGHRAVLQAGDNIFLAGDGASPEGDRPFLDRLDLRTRETERLFHCDPNSYESVVALLDSEGRVILTRRETPAEPPNYYVHDLRAGSATAVTDFPDPAPQLRSVTKQRLTYKRDDGVSLSLTLYLPPDYKQGERLPAVLWAYPLEYNTARTAGQITGSTKRFTTISGTSHLFFLLAGYAILDGATMPVIGDPETANNTYVEQIVTSAKAAIDRAAELGVIAPDRVGVAGHSYGAFMTANLLAHSDLFRAGIARSGAYNRTLTPFGFQNERRTFWEAPEVYLNMSPFMSAHKVNEPLLLIHGMADNNSGTFPVQSERMYQAVRGNGGVVRLVELPHESHGYAARESVEHALAEMIAWFDKHVKTPRQRVEK